jgi:lipoprotein-anchoring transpeptidase ErfK/SrfK
MSKKIIVSIANQNLEAFDGKKSVFEFDCVTGGSDYPTTVGRFNILYGHKNYRSKKYDVQMNYALFFSVDGKAFHQYHGHVPLSIVRAAKSTISDWFGSHGCVRLTEADAKALFNWAPKGTLVQII